MKIFTNKNITQKIIIAVVIVILFNFLVPIRSQASFGGDLLKELIKLFVSLGDVINGMMNHFMLGTSEIIGSSMLDWQDANLSDPRSSLYYGTPEDEDKIIKIEDGYLFEADGWINDRLEVPNILYCPENIFANNIAMLDVNFINPGKYGKVEYKKNDDNNKLTPTDSAKDAAISLSKREGDSNTTLRSTIASWYKAFRNIAIVGLLIVLVYLGIRIMISSTSSDKAKYKESLQDWLVALCLVFFIHYIMAGILVLTENFTNLINKSVNGYVYVDASNAKENDVTPDVNLTDLKFKTTITGYIRFMAQSDDTGDVVAYSIMYIAMIIYTIMFTFVYIKRFLYVAFFTMIAPLVALTYPLDKIRDGKAQAFNMWFKEYTLNVIIQPVHLMLFCVFIGGAMNIVVANPIYALVAMGFLLPAEKVIKKLFGLDRAETAKGLGELAGGALAMKGMSNLIGQFTGKKGKNGKEEDGGSNKIKMNRGEDPDAKAYSLTGVGGVLPQQFANEQRQNDLLKDKTNSSSSDKKDNPVKQAEKEALEEKIADGQISREELSDKEKELSDNKTDISSSDKKDNPVKQAEKETSGEKTADEPISREGLSDKQRELSGYIPNRETFEANIPTGWGKVRAAGGAILHDKKTRIKNKVATPFQKGNRLKTAGKVGRTALKVGGAALGAAALGTVGTAAAVTTGDASKAVSSIMAGATLGAGLGVKVGQGTSNMIGSEIQRDIDTARSVTIDKNERKRQEQAKYDKQWKNNEKNYQYLRSQGYDHKTAQRFLNSDRVSKYLESGVTDIKTIDRAIRLADKQKYDDKYAIYLAKMVNNTSAEFKDAEQKAVRENMMSREGITEKQAEQVINGMRFIKDTSDYKPF